ncbi:peptidase inhibitor family I36 protein [Streptomyces sp. NPDC056069]|uniref:peptidase inhibitor family I36 protein n=1 Tax=Streptomyces sp. NPDC056069 TaxID=3345702 RepID=UPI0035D9E6B5
MAQLPALKAASEKVMVNMLKRIAAVALSALAITVGVVSPSNAANGSCGANEFCLYKNANYSGGVYDYSVPVSENSYLGDQFFGAGTSVNNNASSSVNKHPNYVVYAYENSYQGGDFLRHRPAGLGCLSGECPAYSTLGWIDNNISSHDAPIWVP